MMISVSIMIASFKRTVYTWVAQTISADLLIHQASPGGERSTLTMPHRLRQELGQIDGVRDVDSARGIDVEYAGDLVLLVAVDFDVYAQYGSFPFVAGERQTAMHQVLTQQGVLVSENFSRRYSVGVGDRLVLDTPKGQQTLPVAGVVLDYSSDRGTITRVPALAANIVYRRYQELVASQGGLLARREPPQDSPSLRRHARG